MRRLALALAIVANLITAPIVWVSQAAEDVVRAQLSVTKGHAILEATIAAGWHVNAHKPRDRFLIPTTVEFTPPPGVAVERVIYPEPVERRLRFSGEDTLLLYEGTIRITAPLEGTAAPGDRPLRAVLRYQACDDTRCLPPRTVELVALG